MMSVIAFVRRSASSKALLDSILTALLSVGAPGDDFVATSILGEESMISNFSFSTSLRVS